MRGQTYDFDEFEAVYARPLSPVIDESDTVERHGRRLIEVLGDWCDVACVAVVNRPSSMHSNNSKPYQMQLLASMGFEVPETLITSDADEAVAFWRRHGDVIFKSMSGVRSIVTRLDESRARHLYKLRTLPTQFQALVAGVDVRVHVVGERIFATEIRTGAVDYRYARAQRANVTLRPVDVDDDVGQRCVAAAEALGLPFCGIDFRLRPDGGYVCLEVNPMPGYSYYEGETGQPISGALIDFLVAAGRARNGPGSREQDRPFRRDRVASTTPNAP
jgi:glutathione synthase/RimK-type ligase-like ATP-grasp enzyme